MKLIEKLKNGAAARNAERAEKKAEKKEAVFHEDLVSFVEKEAERRRAERLPYELQWRLNAEFLLGNQMCDINADRMTVENYRPVYDYMSCEIFNHVSPIMQTRRAHLLSVDYDPAVRPGSDDFEDLKKAETATALLLHDTHTDEFKEVFRRSVALAEETGSAFLLTWWDGARCRPTATALTPYEILPEDLGEEILENQRSVILMQVKTVGELRDLYGKEIAGGEVDSLRFTRTCGAGGLGYRSAVPHLAPCTKKDAAILYTYLEKPTAAFPEGRLIITAGGELLHYGALPAGRYPLAAIKSEPVSGQFFGRSVIETLIPYQRCYNGIKNRMHDLINRASCGQLLVEEGSVDADDLSSGGLTPGEPIVYERGASLPKLLEEPAIPKEAPEQLRQLTVDMEYAACVSGLMTDSRLPGGVVSGAAIEKLQSADRVRLSAYADNIRAGLLHLFRLWLVLYRTYLPGEKTPVGAHPLNGLRVSARDLNSDDLFFENENDLKIDREAEKKTYLEALKIGLFSEADGSLSQKAKLRARSVLLDSALLETSEEEQQMKNARLENLAFEHGERPEISEYDDHRLHLDEHRMYVLQKRFRALSKYDPGKCGEMIAHIKAHEEALRGAERQEENERQTQGKEKTDD